MLIWVGAHQSLLPHAPKQSLRHVSKSCTCDGPELRPFGPCACSSSTTDLASRSVTTRWPSATSRKFARTLTQMPEGTLGSNRFTYVQDDAERTSNSSTTTWAPAYTSTLSASKAGVPELKAGAGIDSPAGASSSSATTCG